MLRSLLVAAALLVGCALPRAELLPGPSGLSRVAVDAPVNRTAGDLVVEGPGLFSRLIRQKPETVTDLLAEDLRQQLEAQGFRIGTGTDSDVPVLRTVIRRWEPYAADYSTVRVDIDVALVEPGSGRTLWSASRTGWHVPTVDVRSRPEASERASAVVAAELLAGWTPAAP